ncbi:GIY-YIG nuclease family protein [Clostridium thermobutyricum]|uniref:GIY-YIG nuclease family protein n=1 Tax=Clostridium thermobutyricum TaxID=29372 RepID=UPI0018A8A205|nr:GIY-YIG nuclease family protein [Clostridium thermobutyricum]
MNKLKNKKCTRCNREKSREEFNRSNERKSGLKSWCKECSREYDRNRYNQGKSLYLYMICKNNEKLYIGSTNNIGKRINGHKITNKKSIFHGVKNIYNPKELHVEVCDLNKLGLNVDRDDLAYYEHMLIKQYKAKGEATLNKIYNRKYNNRERFIDEIIIELDILKFEKTKFKL